ncbi:hypothetical protein [Pontivivens nitratireducens]|uniref:Uncharacterized protein n=1 Tax=Pontivivens nitratireducens TaxID=2758038 RepID=A0A6G7VNL6_9RHOB|nr:hypothetical protein [Pontibrevibacter nitratireducens]QIK41512.1 hypothetical protein G8E03_12500 [Pontibrevibacter nitratireducens]
MGQCNTAEIDVARIERALEDVALLIQHDLVYLPIFERLERELEAARTRQDARSRATRILAARSRRTGRATPDDPEP